MEQDIFDLKSVKIHRTIEATVFEVVFAILAISVWGIIIWLVHQAPDIVPTHFDGSGTPNGYGSPVGITIPCAIITIAAIGCMIVAYFPRLINMPYKITNIRQVKYAILSVRFTAITLLLMALAIAYMMLGMPSPTATPILAVSVLLILNIIVFTILGYRAK